MYERLFVQFHQHVAWTEQGATQRIAMTANVLRQRMNNEIRAEFDGSGHNRRRKRRIHGKAHVVRLADLRDRLDVRQPDDRVDWRLYEYEPRVVLYRRFDVRHVAGIDRRHLDTEARQGMSHEFGAARVLHVAHDQVIARRQVAEQQRGRGRHARGKRQARLRTLQHAQLVLQLIDRRIAPARVDVGHVALVEVLDRERLGVLRRESRRHDDARRRRARNLVRRLPGVYGQRLRAGIFRQFAHGNSPAA